MCAEAADELVQPLRPGAVRGARPDDGRVQDRHAAHVPRPLAQVDGRELRRRASRLHDARPHAQPVRGPRWQVARARFGHAARHARRARLACAPPRPRPALHAQGHADGRHATHRRVRQSTEAPYALKCSSLKLHMH